jgi:hypothetical protein
VNSAADNNGYSPYTEAIYPNGADSLTVLAYSAPYAPYDVITEVNGDYIDVSWKIPFDGNYNILYFRI